MKKYLIALAVALMVCLLGMTASAQTADEATTDASEIIADALRGPMKNGVLSSAEAEQIAKEALVSAGWTVVEDISAQSAENDIDPEVLELAYMDIDKADSELKEKILDARKTVIYSYSWVNDVDVPGGISYSADPDTREVSFDPLFSELFPGWDVPRNQCDLSNVPVFDEEYDFEGVDNKPKLTNDVVDETGAALAAVNPEVVNSENRYVPKVTNTTATPFLGMSVIDDGYSANIFKTWPSSFVTSGMTTINLGLSTNNGLELGHLLRKGIGAVLSYQVPCYSGRGYNKVYAQPGYARMNFSRRLFR